MAPRIGRYLDAVKKSRESWSAPSEQMMAAFAKAGYKPQPAKRAPEPAPKPEAKPQPASKPEAKTRLHGPTVRAVERHLAEFHRAELIAQQAREAYEAYHRLGATEVPEVARRIIEEERRKVLDDAAQRLAKKNEPPPMTEREKRAIERLERKALTIARPRIKNEIRDRVWPFFKLLSDQNAPFVWDEVVAPLLRFKYWWTGASKIDSLGQLAELFSEMQSVISALKNNHPPQVFSLLSRAEASATFCSQVVRHYLATWEATKAS